MARKVRDRHSTIQKHSPDRGAPITNALSRVSPLETRTPPSKSLGNVLGEGFLCHPQRLYESACATMALESLPLTATAEPPYLQYLSGLKVNYANSCSR